MQNNRGFIGLGTRAVNGLVSLFGGAVRRPGRTILGLGAADLGITGGENIQAVFNNAATAVVGWGLAGIGIDPERAQEYAQYAPAIIASAGAGLLGNAIGGNMVGMLSAAVPLIWSTFNYVTGEQGNEQVAEVPAEAPTQRPT